MAVRPIGVRWTVGDVSPFGFEALRLSIWGAWRLFGPGARYAVCVNSVAVDRAREATGEVPVEVAWHRATPDQIPGFLRPHLDPHMVEGVAWKFAPVRLFPDRYELSLDNDCIFWEMPTAIREWLDADDPARCVFAEDVRTMLGQFAHLCGPEPRNSGIRGLPPGLDYEAKLREVLRAHPVVLTSELDEQGLQAAAVSRGGEPLVVTTDEVAICSPFPPHVRHFGRCGVHFVGLNARHLPWEYEGRPAVEHIRENWLRHREAIRARVGAPG